MDYTTATRTIHTHCYSNKAYEIISGVIGQMSDGIWENSPAMEKYWRFIDTKRAIDGEVTLEVKTCYRDYRNNKSNGFYGMTDGQVLAFLASKIRLAAQREMKDEKLGNQWKCGSKARCYYLSYEEQVTFAEVFCAYEVLVGHHIDSIIYGSLTGTRKSEAEIADAEAKRAKHEKIVSLYNEAVAEAKAKHEAELKALKTKLAEDLKKID